MIEQVERFNELATAINDNISQVIIGKEEVVEKLLICLCAQGHVLIEDVPGIGKTTLVSALAKSLDLDFKRIQFTVDLMPSDITGFNMYHPKRGEFIFQKGAIMTHMVLADEINRSSPKTQSALLEVMSEYQVSVDGQTYHLPKPFMVLATQNAIEYLGTFPLPEAQLDRFLMKIKLGYPLAQEEMEILELDSLDRIEHNLKTLLSIDEVLWMQQQVPKVECADSIKKYIVNLLNATRNHPDLTVGASPRAGQMLLKASKAKALLKGRSYVVVDDVKSLVLDVLAHRMSANQEVNIRDILSDIMSKVEAPK
ncbi:MAG: MoxR family ATPase [Erysipelothrix sp.]|nr:MoxR family ATPase [Erysipelothrix sp.]